MKLVLVGDRASKGTLYFEKAAAELGLSVEFIQMPYGKDMAYFPRERLEGCLVKLDPPRFDSAGIAEMGRNMERYRDFLTALADIEGVRMLNAPAAILDTLDKAVCKQRLKAAGVAITPVLTDRLTDMQNLRRLMVKEQKYRVFIKPTYGSGAGGVLAYRICPGREKAVLYTSAYLDGNTLINTKKLRRYDDLDMIDKIGNEVLSGGALVEEWMPKARHGDKTYDLRVVYQFGRISYIVARQSRGPVTNLHLNNDALAFSGLALPENRVEAIADLCRDAVSVFPGLNVAGIDILLTQDKLIPHIIEMNAQGDLIYQDIYDQNRIYKDQIIMWRKYNGL